MHCSGQLKWLFNNTRIFVKLEFLRKTLPRCLRKINNSSKLHSRRTTKVKVSKERIPI